MVVGLLAWDTLGLDEKETFREDERLRGAEDREEEEEGDREKE